MFNNVAFLHTVSDPLPVSKEITTASPVQHSCRQIHSRVLLANSERTGAQITTVFNGEPVTIVSALMAGTLDVLPKYSNVLF